MISLADLTAQGRRLLDESEPTTAHRRFLDWTDEVATCLDESYPGSGLSAQWSALASSALVIGDAYYDQPEAWNHYTRSVQARLRWLGTINQHLDKTTATQARQPRGATVRKLFLSHAGADRQVAEYLRSRITASVPGIDVFLASRPGQIPVGADWLATIKEELASSDAYLVLLTPASAGRPWVQFETGAAWMSDRLLVTVIAGALEKRDVPMPLSSFQLLCLCVQDEAEEVFKALGGKLDDSEGFVSRMRELMVTSVESSDSRLGWQGVNIDGRFFAWSGPTIHDLKDRPGVPNPPNLPEALRAVQMVPSFGLRAKLTHHFARGRLQVFETDRKSWRCEVIYADDGDQILLVHPDASKESSSIGLPITVGPYDDRSS